MDHLLETLPRRNAQALFSHNICILQALRDDVLLAHLSDGIPTAQPDSWKLA